VTKYNQLEQVLNSYRLAVVDCGFFVIFMNEIICIIVIYSRRRKIIIIYFLFYVDPQKFAVPRQLPSCHPLNATLLTSVIVSRPSQYYNVQHCASHDSSGKTKHNHVRQCVPLDSNGRFEFFANNAEIANEKRKKNSRLNVYRRRIDGHTLSVQDSRFNVSLNRWLFKAN
jgi:hypothetical protein